MAVTLTLTPGSGSILAAVAGLSPEYERNRLFKWYLDGKAFTTETVEPCEYHEKNIAPVYSDSWHTIRVEIFSADGTEQFADMSGSIKTMLPDLSLWDWSASNGTATAAQTVASHTALLLKQLTANFSYKVWNDLANKVIDLRTETGQEWLKSYATADGVIMTPAKLSLSADMFNALLENLGWPWWTWARDEEALGYIGRRFMQGVADVGEAKSDAVYGAYLIELAKRLNTMTYIYTDTGLLSRMGAGLSASMETTQNIVRLPSAPMAHNANIVLDITRNMTARPSQRFAAEVPVVNSIVANLEAERYRLLVVSLISWMAINAQALSLPSNPFAANALAALTATPNLQKRTPTAQIADLTATLTPSAVLGMYGLLHAAADTDIITVPTALLDVMQNTGVTAHSAAELLLQNCQIITRMQRTLQRN